MILLGRSIGHVRTPSRDFGFGLIASRSVRSFILGVTVYFIFSKIKYTRCSWRGDFSFFSSMYICIYICIFIYLYVHMYMLLCVYNMYLVD